MNYITYYCFQGTDKDKSGDTKDISREDEKETTNGVTPTMDEIKQDNING